MKKREFLQLQKRVKRENDHSKSLKELPYNVFGNPMLGGIAGDLLMQEEMFRDSALSLTTNPYQLVQSSVPKHSSNRGQSVVRNTQSNYQSREQNNNNNNRGIMHSKQATRLVSDPTTQHEEFETRQSTVSSNNNSIISRMKISSAQVERKMLRNDHLIDLTIQARLDRIAAAQKLQNNDFNASQPQTFTNNATRVHTTSPQLSHRNKQHQQSTSKQLPQQQQQQINPQKQYLYHHQKQQQMHSSQPTQKHLIKSEGSPEKLSKNQHQRSSTEVDEKTQNRCQTAGFYSLAEAGIEQKKRNPNHFMSEALRQSSEVSLRPKIRAFLGTNFQTDFFDSLDDFQGCVKSLYTNSRALAWKVSRIADEYNNLNDDDIELSKQKIAMECFHQSLTQPKPKHKQHKTAIAATSTKLSEQQQISSKQLAALPIPLQAPNLSNLQKQQFKLGDVDSFSKDKQRREEIDKLYQTAGEHFESAQMAMLARENDLKVKNEQFKHISTQLVEFREMFRENLNTFKRTKKPLPNAAAAISVTQNLSTNIPTDDAEAESKEPNSQTNRLPTPRTTEGLSIQKRQIPTKKELQEGFRKVIWIIIDKLKKLKLSYSEVCTHHVFPVSPFEREGSSQFFNAVKQNRIEEVRVLLGKERYYVFEFDHTKQTALHWCARRNLIDMMSLICENGADLESQDIGGRTPLFLCVKNGFLDACRMLLARGASPRAKSMARNKPSDYTTSDVIRALLRKAEQLHTMMDLVHIKRKKDFWIRNAVQVFSHHNSEKLNENIYKLKAADLQMN